jgi:hypothetical protein
MRKLLPIALAILVMLFMASRATAESTPQQAAYGAGSVFSTLLYAPFKTSFCVVGGVTSALTLPFGGTDTAGKVATAACGGTWVISPDTLKGKERVRFVGGS